MIAGKAVETAYDFGALCGRYCIGGLAACGVLLLYYAAGMDLGLGYQAVIGYGLFAVVLVLIRLPAAHTQPVRTVILILAIFVTHRYWFFRMFETLTYNGPVDGIAMLLLFAAESYSAIFIYSTGLVLNIWPIRRRSVPLPEDPAEWPVVDVFVPTYDEPVDLVAVTACACTQMDYPPDKLNIHILDDGGTLRKLNDPDRDKAAAAQRRAEKLKDLAQSMSINYLTRGNNERAKAGNINNALFCTEKAYACRGCGGRLWLSFGQVSSPGELILILDCDHVPTRDFLQKTVGFFLRDEKLFMVQTPHFLVNPSPMEKNLAMRGNFPAENEMFYRSVHPGLDLWNSSFFCGSAALLRRKHLAEVGGILGRTITEDAETSLELHARGYRSVYLPRPMVCGLSPETFEDLMVQRSRWSRGMIQILLLKRPFLKKGLRWYQRVSYTFNCMYWFFGLVRSVFLLVPLAYLFLGLRIYNVSFLQILAYTGPHLLCSITVANFFHGEVRRPFFSDLFETAQSFFLIGPVIGTLLSPEEPKFKVTPKGRKLKEDFLSGLSIPFFSVLLLIAAGFPVAAFRWLAHPVERDTIMLCALWILFNMVLLLACLEVVHEARQMRKHHRIITREEAMFHFPGRFSGVGEIQDLSLGGAVVRLPATLAVRRGDPLVMQASDSYGQRYSFNLRVRRVQQESGGSTWLGCRFEVPDGRTRGHLISFVYGDSARWEKVWSGRGPGRVSIAAGLIFLFRKAGAGAWHGIGALIHLITGYLGGLWQRNRQPFSV